MLPGHPPDPSSSVEGDFLIPILGVADALADPEALESWHQALSAALAGPIPHDLLAVWLYPYRRGAVLLGPVALAGRQLAVPAPAPSIRPEQLGVLERSVGDEGYRSTAIAPSRIGDREVGLLLVADLRPERYGEGERKRLAQAAERLAPVLARIGLLWGVRAVAGGPALERLAGLTEVVYAANAEAESPRGYVGALGRGLESLLPHDHLELMVPNGPLGGYRRLCAHANGTSGEHASLSSPEGPPDLATVFSGRDSVILGDVRGHRGWVLSCASGEGPPGGELRAIVGARVGSRERPLAYLLAGSFEPDRYREEDSVLLGRLAGLIAPQVENFIRWSRGATPATPSGVSWPDAVTRLAETLATVGEAAELTSLAAEVAAQLVPHDELSFVLKVGEGRAVGFGPGERRPLAELPPAPGFGVPLGRVLEGELPYALGDERGGCRLVVPLRAAGRVQGALVLLARRFRSFDEAQVPPLQRLADLVAPHLVLLTRSVAR